MTRSLLRHSFSSQFNNSSSRKSKKKPKRSGLYKRKLRRDDTLAYETLEPKVLLASIAYESPLVVLTTDNVLGSFDGTTYAEDATIINTSAVLEDPNNPDPPDYDGPVRAIKDKEGNILYPTDTEFGFYVQDFVGAEPKIRDAIYAEGWVGNIFGEGGEIIGLSVADAPTDIFKSGSPLGTWAAGLGGNSVKASTEHYVVMQNILSDQMYPDDPNAVYQLDNNLVFIGGEGDPDNGRFIADIIAERQAAYDAGDTSLDRFPFADDGTPIGDGVIDIRDILTPNESTVTENIAVGNDYSVTLKDDGKLLYRWGQIVKRPNDIRLGVTLDLPEAWTVSGAEMLNEGRGYRITGAELIVTHAITNNPNDQIRPEDFENEAATGRRPSYMVIEHPDHPGDSDYALWVATVNDFAGDGTFYPSYFLLDDDGNLILDGDNNPIVNTDIDGNPIGTIFREVTPEGGATTILTSSDLENGFTNAWYTTMDRDPFEAVLNENGEYIVGPRWRMKSNKFGQDIPGVEIPLIPHSQPPFQKDNIKYEVGELTTTTINLLDWAAGEDSPLLYSNGWVYADSTRVDANGVTINGLNLTDKLDVAFYIKGDAKATQIYDVKVVLNYELDATYTVTTTADSGEGSLRAALELANATPGIQGIEFAIPGVGVQTITPLTQLPTLTEAVFIDGTTQAGYTVTTPMIELTGSLAGASADGLRISGGDSLVQGLVINGFGGDGIELLTAGGNRIVDNFIGTDATGQIDVGNGDFGVHINQSAGNMLTANVLSGNDHSGIGLRGVSSTENIIVSNLVGTDATGQSAVGNSLHGVIVVDGAQNNRIGNVGKGNVLSGNLANGVLLVGPSVMNNQLLDNQIGTNREGSDALGNALSGVLALESSGNLLMDNLVSGNAMSGIVLRGGGALDNVVVGSRIGTDESGTTAIGNGQFGIQVLLGAHDNRIGGEAESARNVISGNAGGIIFDGVDTTGNMVFGNYVGLDATGTADLGNSSHGITFIGGSHDNHVGATGDGFRNVISGNDGIGIFAAAGTNDNSFVGNFIGTDAAGENGIGNSAHGITISASSGNLISDNVVSASGLNGIAIIGLAAEFNDVVNNQIGRTNSSASASLANGLQGILVARGAHDNNIGGISADQGNTISFNNANGVVVAGSGINNKIRFNSIYSNAQLGIDIGADGMSLNDIGDTDEGANRLQNSPVLTNAVLNGANLEITYTVDSALASATYPIQVDFYLADNAGQEGMSYLFSDEFTAADFAAGNKLAINLDTLVSAGQEVVATATDGGGALSTSEFSTSIAAT